MSKSERRPSAKPALIYLTPLEIHCPLFSHIRHETREENPRLFPILPPSSPPAPSAAHWDTFKPLMPRPRGAAQQIIAVSAVPPARTRPRPRPDPSPGVSQRGPDRAAPAGPYLSCRSSGPAAAVPSPSLARRQLGSARAAPGAPRRGNGNRNSSAAAAAGGARGIPDTWETVTPAVKRRELLGSGGFLALLSLRNCCCPGGRRGQNRRRVQGCRGLPWEECAL